MMEIKMLKAKQIANEKPTPYATKSDFCKVFDQDMNSLYLLSLLLTADHQKAEQCFVAGLEDSVEGNRVFKEWARSWARRSIIQNAARMINPRAIERNGGLNSVSINNTARAATERVEIAAVLALRSFDRFVFVMSVLERYSEQDCSVLLGCTRRDVLSARTRALQQIGTLTELHAEVQVNTSSDEKVPHESHGSVLEAAA